MFSSDYRRQDLFSQLTANLLRSFMLLLSLALFFLALPLHAQSGTQADTTLAESDISADEVNEIARELWCPLCSGVRLDSCELKACDQMKDVIAIKLSEGEDLESIRTYFIAQYGPQVLGEPPLEGFNWLAWILPFVVLAVGGYILWITVRRMTQPAASAVAVQSDVGTSTNEVPDEYEAKLAEELKRYG